jgi:hypothetical protein
MADKKKRKSPGSKNTQAQAQAQDRMLRAVELRKSGATYRAIASALGYASVSSAYDAVTRCLREAKRDAGESLLQIEIERLDAMLLSIAPSVQQGNLHAIDRALKIAERRSRLLGLDKPTNVDITSDGKPIAFECDPGFGDWEPPKHTKAEKKAIDDFEAEVTEGIEEVEP